MLKRGCTDIGTFHAGFSNGKTTVALSAAATFLAFGFIPSESKTCTEIRIFLDAKTGTVLATDMRGDLYSDSAGNPNVSLANTTASGNTAGTWITFTFSQALTAGVQYHFVLRNLAGTPASNFPTFAFFDVNVKFATGTSTNSLYGWLKRQSADSGATWAGTKAHGICGMRVKYSDGTYEGIPVSAVTLSAASTATIYSGRKRGVLYTPEVGVALQVKGVMFNVGKNSTAPTGNLQCEIYDVANGNALVGTTTSVANANFPASVGSGSTPFPFTTPIYLIGGRQYRIVLAETTQSDTSANYFTFYTFTKDSDSGSTALFVDDGVTYFDGTSWADDLTQTNFYWALLLDTLVRDYAVGNPELRRSVGVR